jgi:hypothetical protein
MRRQTVAEFPFQHVVTKLRTTKGSPFALDVMSEAAKALSSVADILDQYGDGDPDEESTSPESVWRLFRDLRSAIDYPVRSHESSVASEGGR